MRSFYFQCRDKFLSVWMRALSVEILFLFFMTYILLPVLQKFMGLMLKLSGYQVITDINLKRALTNPIHLLGLGFVVLVISLFFLIEELLLLFIICDRKGVEKRKRLKESIKKILSLQGLALIASSFLTSFVFHPLYLKLMMDNFQILSFLKSRSSNGTLGNILYGFIIFLIFLFGMFLFFVEYEFFMENRTLKQAIYVTYLKIRKYWKVLTFTIVKSYFYASILFAGSYLCLMIAGFLILHNSKDIILRYGQWLTIMDAINRSFIYFYHICVLVIMFVIVVMFSKIARRTNSIEHSITWLQNREKGKWKQLKLVSKKGQKIYEPLLLVVLFLFCIFLVNNRDFLMKTRLQMGFQNGLEQPEIIAHRGNSSVTPENTLVSIESAIGVHADRTEIDVQMTKDGQLVLMHDKTLERTCHVKGRVKDFDYSELEKLDAGSWFSPSYKGEKIPLLEEVFELSKGQIHLMLELKEVGGREQEYALEIAELIERYDMEAEIIVASFSSKVLAEVKSKNPQIITCLITSFSLGPVYKQEMVDSISVNAKYTTGDSFLKKDRSEYSLYVWTVNNKREILMMKDYQVNGIITDYPIRARELLYQDAVPEFIGQLMDNLFEVFP